MAGPQLPTLPPLTITNVGSRDSTSTTLKAGMRVKITSYRGPKEIACIYVGKEGTLMCCDKSREDTCGTRWLVDLDNTAGRTGTTQKSWHHHTELEPINRERELWTPVKPLPPSYHRQQRHGVLRRQPKHQKPSRLPMMYALKTSSLLDLTALQCRYL